MESMKSERRSLLGAQRQATGGLLPRSPDGILESFAPTFCGSRRREVGAAMKSEFNSKGMGISGFVKSGRADHAGSAAPEKRGSLGAVVRLVEEEKKGSEGFCLFRTQSWGLMLQAVTLRAILKMCRKSKGWQGVEHWVLHSLVQFW